jgi:eukaryotic-like serine/threonine-protein kinase
VVDDAPRILANRYEVGELIGRGGMAEVHIGHDSRLGRTVAIKILRSDLARDPSFQARFRREAQAAASLNHPAIVAVYDTGEDVITAPTGAVQHVPFIVMEYVEGHTVRDILRDGQAVPIDEAVEISAGVLSALEYSHHAGIVHRDIKPANVMLTPTGAVKVMDFGIARALADSAATMTQTQAVIGTAQYLSPEQARGETVDARSDLYSTGCLLFELLTGRPPFTGDSPVAVAYQHVREPAPAPSSFASDVPEPLDRITLKALAKERDSRYSTAAEFRSDLEAASRGGRVAAPAVGVLAATAAAEAAAAPTTQILAPLGSATQVLPAGGSPWPPTGPAGVTGATPTAPAPQDPPKSRRGLWTALVLVLLLAVGALVALAVLNGQREQGAETVTVPRVEGMTEQAALQELQAVGLTMERLEEPSDEVDEGLVVSTDPGGGEEAEAGSAVDVVISAGPDAVQIPEVAGMTQEQATAELREQGFEVSSVEFENAPRISRNEVTKTVPAAGEPHPRGTAVVLYVASGQVDLPDLVGQSREAALATLDQLGLSSRITEEETTGAPADSVVAQDRSPGQVPQATSIGLTVAVAPTTATVPSAVVGTTYEDAVAQLTAIGLTAVRADVASDEPAGQVISADPAIGTTLPVGTEVTLNVSLGPDDGEDEGDTNADGNGNGNGNGGNGNGNGNGNGGNGNG